MGKSPAPKDKRGGPPPRSRWTSFVADEPAPESAGAAVKAVRGLHEQGNPLHRLRVEHNASTMLIHLSDEDGRGWTTIAIDRATRRWAVEHDARQADTASAAYRSLYGPSP